MNFTPADMHQLEAIGKSPASILEELDRFRSGVPFIHLERPCVIGDGIYQVSPGDFDTLVRAFDTAASAGRISRFIPASGAASRMFQALLRCRESGLDPSSLHRNDGEYRFLKTFIDGLPRFAFRHALERHFAGLGVSLTSAIEQSKYDAILDAVLTPACLDYANMPKAAIYFHDYPDGPKTALEEHLAEAIAIADRSPICRIHITVSPEHLALIRGLIESFRASKTSPPAFDASLSTQSPASQTIAVDDQNEIFRDEQSRLVFRPGGHGALLDNLAKMDGDIVFIKNIDNIAPARLRAENVFWKKVLGGILINLQFEIHELLRKLDENPANHLENAARFVSERLGIPRPESATREEMITHVRKTLNRPIRVCGMVRNQGEPGGGPFWVRDKHGNVSCQIVESSQIDHDSPAQSAIFKRSTHFNPVDLVCSLRDYRGSKFDLTFFSDPEACFISTKSRNGRPLKALELPGLWNGAMSNWTSVFVEVPLSTFNPVKTINDLLRPEHQA